MNLYIALKHFHSYWAFIVVLLSLILLAATLYYFFTKKPIHIGLRKVSFYTVLSFHIQFVFGLALYVFSPVVQSSWADGIAMQTGPRLLALEHPVMMFTAVILMTIANAKLKKNSYITGSILAFVLLATLCFYMIPWTQWMANF